MALPAVVHKARPDLVASHPAFAGAPPESGGADALLLENGDHLLLEDGSKLLLE